MNKIIENRFAKKLASIVYCILAIIIAGCSSQEYKGYTGLGRVQFEPSISLNNLAPVNAPISLIMESEDGMYRHTWANIEDFPTHETYYTGRYMATAFIGTPGAEGFDCPYYEAGSRFEILEGTTSLVRLNLQLTQAIINVNLGGALTQTYPNAYITIHTVGHNYLTVATQQRKPLFVTPGDTYVFVSLADESGHWITISPDLKISTVAGGVYDLSVTLEDNDIVVQCGDNKAKTPLTADLFTTPTPTITCSGFDMNQVLDLTEGLTTSNQIKMSVEAKAGLKSLILTAYSNELGQWGLPTECDLIDGNATLQNLGLQVTYPSPSEAVVDYTKLLESLSVENTSNVTLILQARDYLGRVSSPTMLRASIKSVNFDIVEVSKATIGIDEAQVTLSTNVDKVEVKDFSLYVNNPSSVKESLTITGATVEESENRVILRFKVPSGLNALPVQIDYMGVPKSKFEVKREVPEYGLRVDAFATVIRLKVETPKSEITSVITQYAQLKADGADITILERDTDNGLLICTGFKPNTKYTLSSVLIDGEYVASCSFKTEAAAQIPEGDFETFRETIVYEHLASGGIYSSTGLPIFNQQNYVDIKLPWCKDYWTCINAKTFSHKAKNPNTWYIQPSSFLDRSQYASGGKSACMQSVGWSLNGEEIPPYLQENGEFKPYNANIPSLDHISAGYVFLGSYTYDASTMTDNYTEGINFSSRPTSLNGYYRYIPDANHISDRGWCKVELVHITPTGEEVIIASGRMEFSSSPSFTTFNLPLDYTQYNLNASKVKIMFCSSTASSGIYDDNLSIPVTANVQDACFKGSALWVDNLTFAY